MNHIVSSHKQFTIVGCIETVAAHIVRLTMRRCHHAIELTKDFRESK